MGWLRIAVEKQQWCRLRPCFALVFTLLRIFYASTSSSVMYYSSSVLTTTLLWPWAILWMLRAKTLANVRINMNNNFGLLYSYEYRYVFCLQPLVITNSSCCCVARCLCRSVVVVYISRRGESTYLFLFLHNGDHKPQVVRTGGNWPTTLAHNSTFHIPHHSIPSRALLSYFWPPLTPREIVSTSHSIPIIANNHRLQPCRW